MSIKLEILGSSSKGNCYLVQTESSNILIDAGFSGKYITKSLATKNLLISDIHGVFITHEHNDHSVGIKGLSKFSEIKLFANQLTANTINKKISKQVSWNIINNGQYFSFRDFEIVAFSLPHDAIDPVGYVFTKRYDNRVKKICIATDLGYIPYGLSHYTDDANLLILESNHDLGMLETDTKRPIYIKNRIRGKYGHLSNDSAISFIVNHNTSNWDKVLLTHLSHDCNSISAIHNSLSKYDIPKTFDIHIIDPHADQHTPIILT